MRTMEDSPAIRDTLLEFYERRSAGDPDAFDRLMSRETKLHIGTGPGEWLEDVDRLRRGFSGFPLTLEPGPRPKAWSEGSMGWAADEPMMSFGDVRIVTRLTAVFRQEEGAWKMVGAHFSVGVPDEEVTELQKRWLAT
jgi:SnoaL-like domain